MNIKFYTGNTDYPDYRSITSATNTQNTPAGREAGKYRLTGPLIPKMMYPLPGYLPGRPQPGWKAA